MAAAGDEAHGDDAPRDTAEARTALSRRRTLMSKERTFLGWLRSGLSAIAVGFAAARLLDDLEPGWLVSLASTAVILLGVAALWIGFHSYRSTVRVLEREGIRGLAPAIVATLVVVLSLVAMAGIALVFLN